MNGFHGDTAWMGDWTCGSLVPTRKKDIMEMVYFRELRQDQKEAALAIECAWILKDLKGEDYNILAKYHPRLVSDFKYLSFCIHNKREAAVIWDLKRKICKALIKKTVQIIYLRLYPKYLDPALIYTMLVTHPNQPYRSFVK